jgi:hypothetical protein
MVRTRREREGPGTSPFSPRLPDRHHDMVYARRLLRVLRECPQTGQVEPQRLMVTRQEPGRRQGCRLRVPS